jgi:hypothetical protein
MMTAVVVVAAVAAVAVVLRHCIHSQNFFKYLFLAFCSFSPVSMIINLLIFLSLS